MTKMKMVKLLAMSGIALMFGSCIKAPVDITLKQKIEITEEQVKEIADDIYEKLSELEFNNPPPPTISPDECSAAYKIWLRKQFDKGLVPKDIVLASEYGVSSTNSLIHECRSINFQQEYENVLQKRSEDVKTKRKAMAFGVNQFREKLESNKCTDRLIDLDKEKIEILSIDLIVVSNTLTIKAPRYTLYSTYESENLKAELEQSENAEQAFIKDGTLMLMGQTQVIERNFVGRLPVQLNKDKEAFFEAEGPVVSLDGSLFAIPEAIATTPEIKKDRNNREYFVVPAGGLALTLSTRLQVKLVTADALCALNRFRDSIVEDEQKASTKNPAKN